MGCWEEIRYEPAPEVVQSTADEKTAAPNEPAGDGVAATVVEASKSLPPEPALTAENGGKPVAEPMSPPLETPPLELPDQPAPETADTAGDRPPAETTPPADSTAAGDLFGESSTDSAATTTVPAATPSQRLLIWQAAGKWSLAAAMIAKQLPAERFEPVRNEADVAAAALELTLPKLPAANSGQTDEQAVIAALSGEPAASLVEATSERFGAAAGALAKLAIRSNLLLLTYSPRRDDANAQAAADFVAAAEASALPVEAWESLAKLLSDRGEFVAVRAAVFELHREVEKLLADSSRN